MVFLRQMDKNNAFKNLRVFKDFKRYCHCIVNKVMQIVRNK